LARPFKQFVRRKHGIDSHFARVAADDDQAAIDSERAESAFLGDLALHHHNGGCAVGELRGIPGGNRRVLIEHAFERSQSRCTPSAQSSEVGSVHRLPQKTEPFEKASDGAFCAKARILLAGRFSRGLARRGKGDQGPSNTGNEPTMARKFKWHQTIR
jgi:hypothetical protein